MPNGHGLNSTIVAPPGLREGHVHSAPRGPTEDALPSDRGSPNKPAASIDGPINILIVDDEPKNLTVLETVLDDPAYRLVRADSADAALLALLTEEFALLILDIRMPGITGFELAEMIKERKKTSQVPIIFLTAYYSEDQHVLEGYGTGAVDYLHKPVNPAILRSKVAIFAELYRRQREVEASNRALSAEVVSRRQAEEQLRELNSTLEQHVAQRTRHIESLLNEVNHRSKNILSIVMAVAKQSAVGSPREFLQRFTRRVQALATHQDLLVKSHWRSLDLSMLIRAQLAHFEDLVGRRIIIDGTALLVAAPAAQSIAMAVHELATNAVKHGALSGERGQVDIAWQVQDGEAGELRFLMSWRESGGPPARLPTHRGFGSKVIKDMIELGLEGEVQLQFAASGLVWQLDCPAAKVSEDRP